MISVTKKKHAATLNELQRIIMFNFNFSNPKAISRSPLLSVKQSINLLTMQRYNIFCYITKHFERKMIDFSVYLM